MTIDDARKREIIDEELAAWKKWSEAYQPTLQMAISSIYDKAYEEGYYKAQEEAAQEAAGPDL